MLKQCATCGAEKPLSEFPAQKRKDGTLHHRPHCFSCKYSKEILQGKQVDREYHKEYYYANKLDFKYKAYRHTNKSRFTTEPLTRNQAVVKMMQPCHYCGTEKSHGLDRKDSSIGYAEDNTVPCCEKCNNILCDIPYQAKVLLKEGLVNIRKGGLLETWQIPTKRRKT